MKPIHACVVCSAFLLASCADSDTVPDQNTSSTDTTAASHETDVSHGHHRTQTGRSEDHSGHADHGANDTHRIHDNHGDHRQHRERSTRADRDPHEDHLASADHSQHEHDDHPKHQASIGRGKHETRNDAHGGHSKPDASGHDERGHGSHSTTPHGKPQAVSETAADVEAERLAAELAGADAATIFTRRILPILKADTSSSCTECHFAGVELSHFILEDQAATFASLKSTGMIDVDKPDESKLLRFISRKPDKPDPLVERVRRTELVAFRAWIRAAVREPELLAATSDVEVGTSLPPEVIRHARRDRVLSSFIDNIWSEMGRCINCHNPERNRQKIGRNGFTKEDVDAISWIVPRDPAATLRELVDSGNIDTDDPAASPVLTKPAGLEDHGGGPKFFPGSPTYRNFLTFLTDYADITNETYKTAADLPASPREFMSPSEQQLRITKIPADFSDMALQVDLYRWNRADKSWSEHRWATAFSRVNGKQHVWQNPILVTAPADSPLAVEYRKARERLLPRGAYLAKIYIDRDRKAEKDPTYELGEDEFVTQVEVTGEWRPGYQPPKIVEFPKLRDGHAAHDRGSRRDGHAHRDQTDHPAKDAIRIGDRVPDFEVTLNGRVRRLSELQKDRHITPDGTLVLTFWCSFCHSCRDVELDLDKLAQRYKSKAGVIAVDASFGETQAAVTAFAKERGLALPIALNPTGSAADIFGVKATTTTIVIDSKGILRYRGQFADQGRTFAEDALEAVLAGKAVEVDHTRHRG